MLNPHVTNGEVEEDAAVLAVHRAADSHPDTLFLSCLSNMKEIPACTKLLRDQLETIHLDNNYALKTLPSLLGDFPRVRCLDASYCGLTSISPAVCRLSRLTHLRLSNNNLSFLPPEMSQLKKLEELRVDNNKLCVLPGGLVFLHNLRELTVENNPLYTGEQIAGAAHVTLVPDQPSVDCANCCARVRNYQVKISFHRLPCLPKALLPLVFFVCSDECQDHLDRRLEQHDATMRS